MRMRHAAVLAGVALGLTAGSAEAMSIPFSYHGSTTVYFALDTMPTPDVSSSSYAEFDNIAAVVNGMVDTVSIKFREGGASNGGFEISNAAGTVLNAFGAQFFSGTTDHPLFSANSYSLTEQAASTDSQTGAGIFMVGAVPLPASAPMFGAALLGLAGLGYAAKRRKAAAGA